MRMILSVFCVSALAVAAGCDGSGRADVSGQVTFDGQPVEEGNLTLIPLAGSKGVTAGAAISQGRYIIDAESGPTPGRYQVQITARRKTGRTITISDGPFAANPKQIDEMVHYIPARYNSHTELSVEITPGKNIHDFQLVTHTQ